MATTTVSYPTGTRTVLSDKILNLTCKHYVEQHEKERARVAKDIFLNKLALDETKWKLAQFQYNQVRIAGPKKWAILINTNHVATLEYGGNVIYRVEERHLQEGDPMAVAVYHVIQNAFDREIKEMESMGEMSDVDVLEEVSPEHILRVRENTW